MATGGAARDDVRALAGRARPVALAAERLRPALPPLAPLLPRGGLVRGSSVAVTGAPGEGATSLALALAAGPSAAGAWCTALGCPSLEGRHKGGPDRRAGAPARKRPTGLPTSLLGVVAAAAAGVALERFPLVAAPPAREWATVVAALLDAFDLVLAWPPARLAPPAARRLAARARERGAVLVVCGPWPEAADLRLGVGRPQWQGLGRGHGHLAGRRVEVVAGGRGMAARERRAWLWLPAPDGTVATAPAPLSAARPSGTAPGEQGSVAG